MIKQLPKLDCPVYETILPSNKAITLKYRPFLVKEKKILLMALETKNKEDILSAIKKIIQNTIMEPEDLKMEELTTFDIEFLFLQLRARSMGEVVEPKFRCSNKLEDGKVCGTEFSFKINLLEIQPEAEVGHSMTIPLGNSMGIKMKYPKAGQVIDSFMADLTTASATDSTFHLLIDNIEFIYDGEELFNPKDFTMEQLMNFFDNLTEAQINNIAKFFETMPKLKIEREHTCKKCSFHHKLKLSGIESFFY